SGDTAHRRAAPGSRRDLSTHSAEKHLPGALPLAAWIFHDRMAQWRERRVYNGNKARCILCRMLLDADGIAVRLRRHEPAVGGCTERIGVVGEARTLRPGDLTCQRDTYAGGGNRTGHAPLSNSHEIDS